MNRKIDTQLFIYIIGDEDAGGGAVKLFMDDEEDDVVQYYLGLSGKTVGICISDEFISERTAKELLRLLGMSDFALRMFPPPNDDNEIIDVENK